MTTIEPGKKPIDHGKFPDNLPHPPSNRIRPSMPNSLPFQTPSHVFALQNEPPSKRRRLSGSHEGALMRIPPASHGRSGRDISNSIQRQGNAARHSLDPKKTHNTLSSGCASQTPARPYQQDLHSGLLIRHQQIDRSNLHRGPVTTKPFALQVPSSAPWYHSNGRSSLKNPSQHPISKSISADFFPWNGSQIEDVLNELTTRNGYSDKLQKSYNDLSTARPSLWSSAKRKSGLQTLSSLFVLVLNRRQKYQEIPTISTFKPPPRVTLTDAKRESWLKDLSNPTIPLRRLSRTIPHGIRGRVLLHQCLEKGVPISRAVWLAKCVGANEIRAFKRKGPGGILTVGGETKWIKEWTSNLEQFVATIIEDSGDAVWGARVHYGLRLAVQIYDEHLMDRDQYLDWIVRSIAEGDMNMMSIWLLLVDLHWRRLFASRKRGKVLANVFLERLQMACEHPTGHVYKPLINHIVKSLSFLLLTRPDCLLLPKQWDKYSQCIRQELVECQPALSAAFDTLQLRNSRLQEPCPQRYCLDRHEPEIAIIAALDDLSPTWDVNYVANLCLDVTENHALIVTTCIRWCSSPDRHGSHRAYAVARLMRLWSKRGVDIEGETFIFLAANEGHQNLRPFDLAKLISELVGSGHISVGRYLQWLMVHGAHTLTKAPSLEYHLYLYLLSEMPTHDAPDHIVNLRRSILLRASPSSLEEQDVVREVSGRIAQRLSSIFSVPKSSIYAISDTELQSLSHHSKSALARWLRQALCRALDTCDIIDQAELSLGWSQHNNDMLPADLMDVARIFVSMGEFLVLADYFDKLSLSADHYLLLVMVDTVNHHSEIFGSIGALRQLFLSMYNRLNRTQTFQLSHQSLLESLSDLGLRLSGTETEMRHLRALLSQISAQAAVVASSPISDTALDGSHVTELSFLDDVDQMFGTGTIMDRQTLFRGFEMLTDYLQKVWSDETLFPRTVDSLARLQTFNPETFHHLMRKYIENLMSLKERPSLASMLPWFICSRVLTLSDALSCALSILMRPKSIPSIVRLGCEVLNLLTEDVFDAALVHNIRPYRLRDEQAQAIKTCPSTILEIFRLTAGSHLSLQGITSPLKHPLADSLSLRQVLSDAIRKLVDNKEMLMLRDNMNLSDVQFHLSIIAEGGQRVCSIRRELANIFGNVNELNLLHYQLKLRALLNSNDTLQAKSSIESTSPIHELTSAMVNVTFERIVILARLVLILEEDQARTVRRKIENVILESIALCIRGRHTSMPESVDRHLKLVEALSICITVEEPCPLIDPIADTLSLLVQVPGEETGPSGSAFHCVQTMLRLLVFHQSTFTRIPQESLSRTLVYLGLFVARNSNPNNQNNAPVIEHVLDVLCLLSDHLSEDSRRRCASAIRGHCRVIAHSLDFVLATPSKCSDWLGLVSRSSTHEQPTHTRFTHDSNEAQRPFTHRGWEMMSGATPTGSINDTSLSLAYLGAKRPVL